MHTIQHPARYLARKSLRLAHVCVALVGAMGLGSAMAAGKVAAETASSSALSRYEAERAACMDGRSGQDRATCLKEAGAALAEARRGKLSNGESADALMRNAELRCQAVAAEDRDACLLMAHGKGSVSGSVKAGGTMREITIVTVGPIPPTVQPEGDAKR